VTIGQVLFGLILVVLGILLILNNVDLIDIGFGVIWPLAIVFLGLYIILKEFETKKRRRQIMQEGKEVE
jgi:hypothetical protein